MSAEHTAPPPAGQAAASVGDLATVGGDAPATRTLPPPAAPPGYRLDGELGRGGMGVVYLATQTGLNRPVALKMVLGSTAAGSRELIRFLAEAEAVASVRHPNVVEVYQFGDHQGRPFLAMEYCPGRLPDPGGEPFDRVADLVAKVAAGVGAAHAAGIVHRDLKPGNVLLSESGEPKVTDFGLAKRLAGDSELTRTHAVMGTPAYMAPEQAQGGTKFVGPPADVWALGVMLYERLTGRRPFPGDDTWQVLAAVQRGDFPRPRAVDPRVPRDLELVCLKCLRREPHERYETAADLAADLRRWRAGEPTLARPAGAVRTLTNWVRRNPGVSGALAAAVLALAGGAAVGTWQAVRATAAEQAMAAALADVRAEKDRTAAALDRATAEQKEAAAARGRTLTALRAMTDEAGMDRLRRTAGPTDGDRKFLRSVEALWAEFAAARGDTPDGRAVRAEGLLNAGELKEDLGDPAAAEANYRAARGLLAGLAAASPADRQTAFLLGKTVGNLAVVANTAGRADEAERLLREAIAVCEPLAGPEAADYLGRTRLVLASVLAGRGRYAEAEPLYRVAIAALERAAAERPADPGPKRHLARTRQALAGVLGRTGRAAEAGEQLRQSVAARRELVAAHPAEPGHRGGLAAGLCELAEYTAAADPAGAGKLYQEAITLRRKLVADFPADADFRFDLTDALTDHARRLGRFRQFAEAGRVLDEAVPLHRRLAADHPGNVRFRSGLADALLLRADLALDAGRPAAAAGPLREAEPVVAALLAADPGKPFHRRLARGLHWDRVNVCLAAGDLAGVVPAVDRMVEYGDPGRDRLFAAVFLARCVPVAERTAAAAGPAAAVVAERYAAAAVAHLGRAGPPDAAGLDLLRNGRELDPVRRRLDFRWQAAKLEARAKGGTP